MAKQRIISSSLLLAFTFTFMLSSSADAEEPTPIPTSTPIPKICELLQAESLNADFYGWSPETKSIEHEVVDLTRVIANERWWHSCAFIESSFASIKAVVLDPEFMASDQALQRLKDEIVDEFTGAVSRIHAVPNGSFDVPSACTPEGLASFIRAWEGLNDYFIWVPATFRERAWESFNQDVRFVEENYDEMQRYLSGVRLRYVLRRADVPYASEHNFYEEYGATKAFLFRRYRDGQQTFYAFATAVAVILVEEPHYLDKLEAVVSEEEFQAYKEVFSEILDKE